MARSGINRALVQKARDALLARGEHYARMWALQQQEAEQGEG